jgi:hypothetical protein
MTEEELKRRAKKCRVIPDESWDYLEGLGFVEDALLKPFDEEAVEYIIKKFDDLAAASPNRAPSRTLAKGRNKGHDMVRVPLEDLELERQAALEEFPLMAAVRSDGIGTTSVREPSFR